MIVIVYLGPSLDKKIAKRILPEAIYLPPIRQADLISDIDSHRPTHVLIIDGEFGANLSVWHKEICYALLKGIKVYGSSSMGALRAAELADVGMVGVGKIFWWYYEGVIEADDEVACLYHKTPGGNYQYDTWPLVNIRAGALNSGGAGSDEEVSRLGKIHWTERSALYFGPSGFKDLHDQKALDAIQLLETFRDIKSNKDATDITYVTPLFSAMLEREKRVTISGVPMTLGHIDPYILLHSPEHHQISFDSKNRALALLLADLLCVSVTPQEANYEAQLMLDRIGIDSGPTGIQAFESWLESNAMTKEDYQVLAIQNARIARLHKALVTTMMFRRQTKIILDYMRTHDQLRLWIEGCTDMERYLVDRRNDEQTILDPQATVMSLLSQHLCEAAISIQGPLEEFARDSGLGTLEDLSVCLSRYAFAKAQALKH